MKWPNDWNRPLSPEEQAIARRLKMAPKEPLPEPPEPEDKSRKWFEVEA